MKINTKFTVSVRLLIGSKLSIFRNPPKVKVTIISEVQAIALLKNDKVGPGETSGVILNNLGTMEYHQATGQHSVSFRNMQLEKIKRAEKKGMESVMDEKFFLLFQFQFDIGDGEQDQQVSVLSVPVVVIVHSNQEPHAWATVTWDNAVSKLGHVPFQVPEKVPWKEMADVLSSKFKTATGCELMSDNLHFLSCKVFRSAQIHDNSLYLTRSQFSKETLPECGCTFWEWFYAIMKITQGHLRNLWNDGLIMGFVSRHQAEEMLLKCCSGTFLLRFSDSEPGGVTIACVTDSQQRGQEVLMIQPFTSRDFVIRSLADRIYDLKELLFLYPGIPKHQAFGKYYTPYTENQSPCPNGYIKSVLVTQIPGSPVMSQPDLQPPDQGFPDFLNFTSLSGSSHGFHSFPVTPQPVLQSPDRRFHNLQSSNVIGRETPLPVLDDIFLGRYLN